MLQFGSTARLAFVVNLICNSNRPHFIWIYRRNNILGMLEKHSKEIVNHSPSARYLYTFRVSHHPSGKPIESAVH